MLKDKPKNPFDDQWNQLPNGGASWAGFNPPPEPAPGEEGPAMHLWISGFFDDDAKDDSLKYKLTVQPEHEAAVLRILGWKSLEESPGGEWLLTCEQVKAISLAVNERLPTNLDIFIGVRA